MPREFRKLYRKFRVITAFRVHASTVTGGRGQGRARGHGGACFAIKLHVIKRCRVPIRIRLVNINFPYQNVALKSISVAFQYKSISMGVQLIDGRSFLNGDSYRRAFFPSILVFIWWTDTKGHGPTQTDSDRQR